MPISVVVRSGRGTTLREGDYPYDWPILRIRNSQSGCPLLAGVDPIGTTMFNRFQMPLLKLEVEHILTWDGLTDQQRLGLRAVTDLCDFALTGPHQYHWFFGD